MPDEAPILSTEDALLAMSKMAQHGPVIIARNIPGVAGDVFELFYDLNYRLTRPIKLRIVRAASAEEFRSIHEREPVFPYIYEVEGLD